LQSVYLSVTPANFDFHCHSTVSDGLLPPKRWQSVPPPMVSTFGRLTDHDDLDGLGHCQGSSRRGWHEFREWRRNFHRMEGVPIHIVGLGFDPAHPTLVNGLDELRTGRLERAKRMGEAWPPSVFQAFMKGRCVSRPTQA
jgi:predicted metal-dependent phosphoesterase TrpH